jgi:cytidylate kinase
MVNNGGALVKVTITIEGKQGEGKSTVARELLETFADFFVTNGPISEARRLKFNTYLSDDGTVERRTSSQFPHSVVITTIQTDEVSK